MRVYSDTDSFICHIFYSIVHFYTFFRARNVFEEYNLIEQNTKIDTFVRRSNILVKYVHISDDTILIMSVCGRMPQRVLE